MSSIRDLLHPTDESPFYGQASRLTTGSQPNIPPATPTFPTVYLTIEYILDTICPHCYIGLRHLESAIAIYKTRHRHVEFEVVCTPFVLEPTLYKPAYEKAGIPFNWRDSFGSSRASHILLRLALEASPTYVRSTAFSRNPSRTNAHALKIPPEQLAYLRTLRAAQIAANATSTRTSASSTPPTPESRASSQGVSALRQLVSTNPYVPSPPVSSPQPRGPGLQLSLVLAICRSFFERDVNIFDEEKLVDIAKSVLGFSEMDIRSCMNSEDWARLIEILSMEARARIDGPGFNASAPAIIFQNQFLHPGWAQVETLLEIFDDLREGRRPRQPAA